MNPLAENLQGDLSCSICLDNFEQPVITPCSHTFCQLCLESVLKFKRECPDCRTVIPLTASFPRVLAIKNVIERVKSSCSSPSPSAPSRLTIIKDQITEQIKDSCSEMKYNCTTYVSPPKENSKEFEDQLLVDSRRQGYQIDRNGKNWTFSWENAAPDTQAFNSLQATQHAIQTYNETHVNAVENLIASQGITPFVYHVNYRPYEELLPSALQALHLRGYQVEQNGTIYRISWLNAGNNSRAQEHLNATRLAETRLAQGHLVEIERLIALKYEPYKFSIEYTLQDPLLSVLIEALQTRGYVINRNDDTIAISWNGATLEPAKTHFDRTNRITQRIITCIKNECYTLMERSKDTPFYYSLQRPINLHPYPAELLSQAISEAFQADGFRVIFEDQFQNLTLEWCHAPGGTKAAEIAQAVDAATLIELNDLFTQGLEFAALLPFNYSFLCNDMRFATIPGRVLNQFFIHWRAQDFDFQRTYSEQLLLSWKEAANPDSYALKLRTLTDLISEEYIEEVTKQIVSSVLAQSNQIYLFSFTYYVDLNKEFDFSIAASIVEKLTFQGFRGCVDRNKITITWDEAGEGAALEAFNATSALQSVTTDQFIDSVSELIMQSINRANVNLKDFSIEIDLQAVLSQAPSLANFVFPGISQRGYEVTHRREYVYNFNWFNALPEQPAYVYKERSTEQIMTFFQIDLESISNQISPYFNQPSFQIEHTVCGAFMAHPSLQQTYQNLLNENGYEARMLSLEGHRCVYGISLNSKTQQIIQPLIGQLTTSPELLIERIIENANQTPVEAREYRFQIGDILKSFHPALMHLNLEQNILNQMREGLRKQGLVPTWSSMSDYYTISWQFAESGIALALLERSVEVK